MKNNQKGSSTILVTILILIIIAGGIYIYKNKNIQNTAQGTVNSLQSTTTQILSNDENQTQERQVVLTKAEAEVLVYKKWSNCSQGDCAGVTVTVTQNGNDQYIVTAVFIELDDSTSQTKRVSVASYSNGTWTLGEPSMTRMCGRGNSDGTTGWTAGLCI